MYATARLIVRNDAAAEDATQEALMNAWRHLPSLRDPDRFEAWLYRLLVNACRTQLRKPGSHDVVEIEVVDRSRDGGDPSGGLVDRDQLERGFRRLDADQRAVLILHLYRGYTVPEVAEMVGIPVGTAKSRIHRGHERAAGGPRGRRPSDHRDRGEPAMSERADPGRGFEDQLARWFEQTAPSARARGPARAGPAARPSPSVPDPGGGRPAARWTSSIGPGSPPGAGLSLAAVLALIAMVLGAALFAGSHPRLPLPLGRNGLLVAGRPGELLLIDPTGTTVARTATGELTGFGALVARRDAPRPCRRNGQRPTARDHRPGAPGAPAAAAAGVDRAVLLLVAGRPAADVRHRERHGGAGLRHRRGGRRRGPADHRRQRRWPRARHGRRMAA